MIEVHAGFEVGSGERVTIPAQHIAVTGQTQMSGKTTTLEALANRAFVTVLTFITKRGERSFESGRRVQPYFRDRADWQFVDNLLSAVLQEKNKFLRPWIMRICRNTRTLADVHAAVRTALKTAKGINEGVYTQLDAYLDMIVPEIARAKLAPSLDLADKVNVMDISDFDTPMQMLFVQSAIDWINDHEDNTVVVIPEAWEFIPEGKGSPVKASAISLARKGAAIGNFIWVDSQDMAGVDKTILRACTTWLIGVQREANEIKRSLSNIPAGIKKPNAGDVATLERGQFYVCWGKHCVKTYIQPTWLTDRAAMQVAQGLADALQDARDREPKQPTVKQEPDVKASEARRLEEENAELKRQVADLTARLDGIAIPRKIPEPIKTPARVPQVPVDLQNRVDFESLYGLIRERLLCEDPKLLIVSTLRQELEVSIKRKVIKVDGTSLKGRIASLIANGFYDNARSNTATTNELKRVGGASVNFGNLAREMKTLASDGFLTAESDGYQAVQGMKVNITEE